jgi:hypothetical protein
MTTFTAENTKKAARLFDALQDSREAASRIGDGRLVDEVWITSGFGSDGVSIQRDNLLFQEALEFLIRAANARSYMFESKLRDLGAEVPE